jgi:SagB-type dehydrogenase family enzyme
MKGMNTKLRPVALWAAAVLFTTGRLVIAQELKPIRLLPPEIDGGKPLMQALRERHSSRVFSREPLPLQILANLLWAADGTNRPDSGKRTAPSAMNWQEIDLYVATADGLYLYNARGHTLIPVLEADIRAATGRQPFVAEAPLNLVYVADYARMTRGSDEDRALYSAAGAGFISENVYLYCASAGLATVVRGTIDRPALAKTMKLRPDQRILLAQTVGYPAR